jgi:DUF1365 family protein
MSHALLKFKVFHERFSPKKYKFIHDFFWFKIDLSNKEKWPTKLFSFNRFNLYSFYESDHLKLGKKSAKDNYIEFARMKGLTKEITNVTIYTQVRFLGYVFNPVSFIFLTDIDNDVYGIIEVGNTFNELKPFWVSKSQFLENTFKIRTKKHFYVSPFTAHDNELEFFFSKKGEEINISVHDYAKEELVIKVLFKGIEEFVSTWKILKVTFKIPFVTIKIIILIHFHALMLWMRGIKFYRKEEFPHLQKGKYLWKISKEK